MCDSSLKYFFAAETATIGDIYKLLLKLLHGQEEIKHTLRVHSSKLQNMSLQLNASQGLAADELSASIKFPMNTDRGTIEGHDPKAFPKDVKESIKLLENKDSARILVCACAQIFIFFLCNLLFCTYQ